MSRKRSLVVHDPKPTVLVTTATLQAVREDAVSQHLSIRKTIAELEELSNEIEATLAFLKARR